MRCRRRLLAVLVGLFAGNAMAHPCDATYCTDALVVGISDGDTVTVLGDFSGTREQKRVRLTEIDTPERRQPWGTRARQALADKVFQRRIQLASEGEDRYGRLLGRLYLGDRDINREMVREGHAWVYRRYSSDVSLLEDEQAAQQARAGLWSLPDAQRVPPWEWRRGSRRQAVAQTESITAQRKGLGGSQSFECGTKTYCRDMSSCEEARFFLRQCGLQRLDGDQDGTPCERLCAD